MSAPLCTLLSLPVIVVENAPVAQVCVVMATRRVDAVLAVDASGSMRGILTAGDISRRVVAAGLSCSATRCKHVMTMQPMAVSVSTPASLALRQMVARRCRHLPVLSDPDFNNNNDDSLAGLLDITKCVYSRTTSLDHLDRVRMNAVSVLMAAANHPVPLIACSASIRDACVVMRDTKHTAVLVVSDSDPDSLVGILTNKDVMVRVLATGVDPESVMVQDAMTPRPDFVAPETPVLDALKMLKDGHYLHMPVMKNGKVVALVDLLMLTMSILDRLLKIDQEQHPEHYQTHQDNPYAEGPLWHKFWNSSANQSLDSTASSFEEIPADPVPTDAIDDADDAASITSAGAFYQTQQRNRVNNQDSSVHPTPYPTPPPPNLQNTPPSPQIPQTFTFKIHDQSNTIHKIAAPTTCLDAFTRAVAAKTKNNRTGESTLFYYKDARTGERKSMKDVSELHVAVMGAIENGLSRVVVYVVENVASSFEVAKQANPNVNVNPNRSTMASTATGTNVTGVAETSAPTDWVLLNVGGVHFETVIATLVGGGSLYFTVKLAAGKNRGRVNIDRDGELFRHVLHYLRTGCVSASAVVGGSALLHDLEGEAEFYGCEGLKVAVRKEIERLESVVEVEVREEMVGLLGKGYRVLFVEDLEAGGKRYLMKMS